MLGCRQHYKRRMKTLLCGVIILCLGFTSAQAQNRHACRVRSRNPDGTSARCFDDDDCPNSKDTCEVLRDGGLGICCAGCRFGEPLQGAWCGGWPGRICPLGFRCVSEPFIRGWPRPIGQCCSRGLHEND